MAKQDNGGESRKPQKQHTSNEIPDYKKKENMVLYYYGDGEFPQLALPLEEVFDPDRGRPLCRGALLVTHKTGRILFEI
jgi:hypothetical protein